MLGNAEVTAATPEATLTETLRPFWENTQRVLALVFGWLHEQANAS